MQWHCIPAWDRESVRVHLYRPMKPIRLLLVLLALATGAFAQENATKLALAREVITVMKVDKMFDAMTTQMKQMANQSMAVPPNATPEQKEKFEKFRNKVTDLSMEAAKGMVAQMDHLYADVYSEAELQAMKQFFGSPEGQSMLTKQPQVLAHMMPLMQQMQRELMPKVQALTQELEADLKASKAAKPADAPAPPAKNP